MEKIIEQIFNKFDYKHFTNREEVDIYEIEEKKYYMVTYFNKDDLMTFFESEKTNRIFSVFEYLKTKRDDANKNTSLIILLKSDNLENDFTELVNQIYKIEEDEYFFRKYIIIYSDSAIKKIKIENDIVKYLQTTISDNGKLEEFRKNNFKCSEYFVILQLFIKFHFFKINHGEKEYNIISDILKKRITEDQLTQFNEKYFLAEEANKFDSLSEELFLSEETGEADKFLNLLEV